ncbi:MarR family winged helix-turn-helix transcriptional regulator [Streptomyces reniochalinae]|uniref:MarR family transcriptional regulator n=1 Tax=Streptomyces reniochalinae TaxID=2250578 RepID=A0A367E9Z5_9ACTN|nr:MarR family transcriptional regulator [Streptomyces reniochalinae]RCG14874.1 MarR family transcriptional regulator [Streptomyces reniochalinae]
MHTHDDRTGTRPETVIGTPAQGQPAGLESLGYQLALSARRARAGFERRLAEAGAGFATWTVLELLAFHGPMVQGRLADALGVRGPTLTRQLDRLAATGLLRKLPIAGDRRKAQIVLTTEGVRLHARLTAAAEAANAQLIAGFAPEEVAALRGFLDRVADNVASEPATEPLSAARRLA